MGSRFAPLIVLVVLILGIGSNAAGQACTNNATATITGTVYAPNGTDRLPNVTVYIPTTTVDPFVPRVSCPLVGAAPSGNPLIGTVTDVHGNFTLIVPVGSNIQLVIVSGRWRRILNIPSVTACVPNVMPANFAVMPSDQTQGDIPLIAIATGSADSAECVLLKMGINKSEFTNPGGGGRINLYGGGTTPLGAPTPGSGVVVDSQTPTQASLMGGNGSILNQYDVLMLPCEGNNYLKPAQELANLVNFADFGGRIYSSHYSYSWMYKNPPFDGVANWTGGGAGLPDGTATVNMNFTGGQTLATWLQEVNATTILGQMPITALKHDMNGIILPTQSWLTLNAGVAGDPNPVMQFVFDTPIPLPGKTVNQCGRVLYNEYHVENITSSANVRFPNECNLAAAMTPQEKLLEYMLFELTDEGGQPSLAPLVQDFGSEAIGFSSAPVTFTWINNSSFASQVTSATGSRDFVATAGNNCATVAGGASCQITVVFTPTVLGAETGTLTVVSSGNPITAVLTGTGTPGFSLSGTTLSFGNLDVGASVTQTLTLKSLAPGPLPVPTFVATGQYAVNAAACGSTLAALGSCAVKVTFSPLSIGPQNGTVGVDSTSLLYSGLSATLTGNGVDFTIGFFPTSGTVVAGDGTTATATLTPLAGFAAPVSLACNVAGAAASSCVLSTAMVTPTSATAVTVSMTTTSQYTVVGFGGFGGPGYLWLVGMGSGLLLWRRRRSSGAMLRGGLMLAFLAAIGLSLSGCSGKVPTQNAAFTGPGSYTVQVTATDGFLHRFATYTLTVNAK